MDIISEYYASLQDNYSSSKKQQRIKSSTPERSSEKKSRILDFDEFIQTIVMEIKKQQLLIKEKQLEDQQISNIRKLVNETQSILELILKHADHWCRHCVEVHLYEPIARFYEIQKITQSYLHQLDQHGFYKILSKTSGLSDSINDRASPVQLRSELKTPQKQRSDLKSSQKFKSDYRSPAMQNYSNQDYESAKVIEILEELRSSSQIFHQYLDHQPLEALQMIVRDLLKQNKSLQSENQILNNMLNENQNEQGYQSAQFRQNNQEQEIKMLFEERERVINDLFQKLEN